MLALFTPSQKMPEELAEFSAIITEKAQDPLALLPLTEEEQVCVLKAFFFFFFFCNNTAKRLASVAQSDARLTGDQEIAGLILTGSDNILSWRLVIKCVLRSFSPFC